MWSIATEDDIFRWTLIIVGGYVVTAYVLCADRVRFFNGNMPTTNYGMAKMFDGVTLAVSLLLLLGIVRPNVLILLGNLKPFLITAGGGLQPAAASFHGDVARKLRRRAEARPTPALMAGRVRYGWPARTFLETV